MIHIARTVYVVMFVMQSKLWGWECVVPGFEVCVYLREETRKDKKAARGREGC